MKKRIFSMILAIVMVVGLVSCFSLMTFAADINVAKIGETGYETLSAAIEAANSMTNAVIMLYEDINTLPTKMTAPMTIKGAVDGIDIDCAIAEYWNGINGEVVFENLTFNNRISTEYGQTDSNSNMTLKFVNCKFKVSGTDGYAIQAGASWNNNNLGGLVITNCEFSYVDTAFKGGYMIYAQCVNSVSITNNTIDGNNLYRGAIHLGDSTDYATTAEVSGNTIKNFCRGVMMGNRVTGSTVTITGNTFENINYNSADSKAAAECAPIFIHENASADCLSVTVTDNTVTGCTNPMIYSEDTDSVEAYVSTFTGNTKKESTADSTAVALTLSESYYAPKVPTVTYVAQVGEGETAVPYTSLDDAFAAATEGNTITLLTDATPTLTSQRAITNAAVIDLGGNKLTLTEDDLYFGTTTFKNGTIVVDPSVRASTAVFWMFEGQTLIFDKVEIVATGVTGTYLIGINGGTDSAVQLINGSKITIENTSTANLTAVICDNGNGNSVVINESTISVSNIDGRFYLGGQNGTAIVENSAITLNGVKEGFYLRVGQNLTIEGNSNVYITLNPDSSNTRYGINLTDVTATYTKAVTAEVNATDNAPAYVASVNGVGYTDLQEAIKVAAPAGTVEILSDVTVDEWIMFAETMSIGNGNLITLNINGLTINGNGKTLTIKSIESAGNGNRLFYDAQNLSINNLTIEYIDDAANQGGIGLQSGTLSGVNFVGGGYGVLPGDGEITITGCNFKTNSTAIYYEQARDNLVVTGNTFNQPENVNVILLRGNTTFTNNTVNSGRTVNVVSGSPVVTGNDFNDVRLKVYNAATAEIENNTITVLAFNDETEVKSAFEGNILSADAQAVLDSMNVKNTVYYTITYTDGVDDEVIFTDQSYTIEEGDATPEFAGTPTRTGYTFAGWNPAVSETVTEDITYTAVWQENSASPEPDPDTGFDYDTWYWALMMLYNQQFEVSASASEGGAISPAGISKVKYDKNITYTIIPDEGYAIADVLVDGKSVGAVSEYTIKRIKKDQTIHAIFVKTAWENPYTDVSDEAWYYEDVEFVSENGLMIGTGDNKFSPSTIVNRAMLVTVLWRLEGSPVVDSPVDFYDVPADEWYTAAVNWAAANGIVNGYGDGIFGAMNDLTHEQIMAILNRYAVYKKWSENVSGNADNSYTNSEWAENNVLWADLNGMFDGIGSNISDLTEGADRAELAAYLRRFCERFMAE